MSSLVSTLDWKILSEALLGGLPAGVLDGADDGPGVPPVPRPGRGSSPGPSSAASSKPAGKPPSSASDKIFQSSVDTGLLIAGARGPDRRPWGALSRGGRADHDGKRCECSGNRAVVDPHAALVAADQPGLEQDAQVVADGRLGQSERLGQLAHTGLPAGVRLDQRQ